MTTETYRALELLRISNNLLECAFWAADSLDDRGAALTSTIMEAQQKLEAAMVAFLHADEAGGRFTDGRLGGWYPACELETAIAETMHHNDRRLRLSAGGFPNRIQIRELIVTIKTDLVDVRGLQKDRPELYRDADYSASQTFASEIRWPKSLPPENGVVFDSVRRKRGTNVCIFWPSKVPLPVVQGDHFEYQWDAAGHPTVMKLTNIEL
jgi:hypothetical protein